MHKLQNALGVGDLLTAAEVSLPGWGLSHPDLGRLLSLDDVVRASRTGSHADRDAVLFDLAWLASQTGGDDLEAAAVLCQLLIPGVISKLGGMALPLTTNKVNELAAQHLWIQCRTFAWQSRPRVGPSRSSKHVRLHCLAGQERSSSGSVAVAAAGLVRRSGGQSTTIEADDADLLVDTLASSNANRTHRVCIGSPSQMRGQ